MDVILTRSSRLSVNHRALFRCILLILLLGMSPSVLKASSSEPHAADSGPQEDFDAGEMILDHVMDSYTWHIMDVGQRQISISLPVILFYQGKGYFFLSSRFDHGHASYKGFAIASDSPGKGRIIRVKEGTLHRDENASFLLDLSITKNVVAIFISGFIMCLIFIRLARRYVRKGSMSVPHGFQSFMEPLLLFVRDGIAIPSIGRNKYKRFLPFLMTLFFFIFSNNLMSLVPFFPGGANVMGNISVTMVLALFTFFTIIIFANKNYWIHIFNTPGVPLWLKLPIPLMPIIELTGFFIRPFVLMVRLFANIAAGHMILLGFVSLIFVLGHVSTLLGFAISPLSVMFLIFMNFLELLVAFLQAYVFTLFSAIFFGMAIPEEHH
ncbi:MAG: F0F1 ATP synthase subunit A [Bacteroidales bacterium]